MRAGVTRIDEVPIVDGLAAVVKMAEVMADFKKLGISVTRRGYLHAHRLGRPGLRERGVRGDQRKQDEKASHHL